MGTCLLGLAFLSDQFGRVLVTAPAHFFGCVLRHFAGLFWRGLAGTMWHGERLASPTIGGEFPL